MQRQSLKIKPMRRCRIKKNARLGHNRQFFKCPIKKRAKKFILNKKIFFFGALRMKLFAPKRYFYKNKATFSPKKIFVTRNYFFKWTNTK
jgi:hypothetical protein